MGTQIQIEMKLNLLIAGFALAKDDSGFKDNTCYRDGVEVDCNSNPNSRTGSRIAPEDENSAERRYSDLKGMAVKLWEKRGFTGSEKFDERKYWAYGCHCFMLGDRPMTDDRPMPFGMPKDVLDAQCRVYKHCQRCVRQNRGDSCIGEFTKYTWRWNNNRDTLVSPNAENSCERDLFECDKQFVYNMFENKDVFDITYHAFWGVGVDGSEGFVPTPETCPNAPGTGVPDYQCCGGGSNPFLLYNANQKKCCSDGKSVVRNNESCPY